MVKITHLSDTHGIHEKINTNGGDILIHTGDIFDFSNKKSEDEIIDWFDNQNYQLKIIIKGNHDYFKSKDYGNTIILDDELIIVGGIRIQGSTATLPEKASKKQLNVLCEDEIYKKLNINYNNVDILCTHGAPKGIFDIKKGDSIGSVSLYEYVMKIKPKYHLFGHCHHSIGQKFKNGTIFINNSIVRNCNTLKIQSMPIDFFYDI